MADEVVKPKRRAGYGDPEKPVSISRARNHERKMIGLWLQRWANVRMRGSDYSAVEKKAAHTVLMLGTYIENKAGDLGNLDDLGHTRKDKHNAYMRAARTKGKWLRKKKPKADGNH